MDVKSWRALALILFSTPALAMDLNTYLDKVVEKHQGLKSLRMQSTAAEEKHLAGDIGLVPVLTAKGEFLNDKKQPNQMGATESKVSSYSFGIAKKFSTGTALSFVAKSTAFENENIAIPAYAALFSGYAQGSLSLGVSQSLWKDGFGRSTRLRWERETAIKEAETGAYDLQSRQILAEAESAYWDTMYIQQELNSRKLSLERAQKLESWIARRRRDGISDQADVLNTKALVALRQMQLENTQDELTANENKIRDFLELPESEPIPKLSGSLTLVRNPQELVGSKNGKAMRLDAYLAKVEAQAKKTGAEEALEATKADLTLSAGFSTNSYVTEASAVEAASEWTNTDTPTTQLAISWTYLLDTEIKKSVSQQAKSEAMASEFKANRKQLESETAWSELVRRHQELSKKIASATNLKKIQTDRAQAQQIKFGKGRTVTSEVITSEQDAAEAELSLIKMQAEQRKLEAQSRMFVESKENP